ncbi:octopamine receptor beta-1R-like [Actinia tenebrosa]|uniref:Octopamine receptor beta-1R-like n=1 Tax=Actinia tenebrosa TaxID=6105 RepID=A0A6P8I936_ACTTE|nr:octopamine receptor beta-1R-like [Actinia tenebrosa]XP_031563737.1 octopamine receptor beta-1R-like [Actinia tenebrosa]XP_031563738.1 octopamine receptor beta-1R-like [Actinia tenebrosa]
MDDEALGEARSSGGSDHLSNITSWNSSSFDSESFLMSDAVPLWDTVVLGIIASLSLCGNGVVILLIGTRKKLRKHASPNWFVLSLALADMCVGGLYAPSRFICRFATSCSVITWNIIYYFQSVFLSSSVLNLCVLTFDRYLAVVHPFTYHNVMNSARVFHLIQLAWWVAVLLNIPFSVIEFHPQFYTNEARMVHSVSHMVIFAFVPSLFMIYAYIAIMIIIRRHKTIIMRQEMQIAANFQQETTCNRQKNHTKDGTMRAVGVIVLMFIICSGLFQWLTICSLLDTGDIAPDSLAYFIIFTLLNFKSAVNVVVYALLRKDFQKELKNLLRTCCS